MSEDKHLTAQSELEKAQVKQINTDIQLKRFGFYQRWLIIWLTIGGFIKLDLAKEVLSWISG
ncbi:hypothetical protein [Vibrio scophthalmi]|uniref:Uncharacterized protein n=1 Tax=Vibrio scophthalmi TaxID=45658 RepID=A0A1E3WIR4_9VIBR|nr:hypothetical protein [Vibrio scophthalmi]ODS09638.1 hypothetical protein VSF3289_03302 [Vibrio scophthalmi]